MTLVAHALSFAYRPDTPVLRGVGEAFEPGAVTAILGPNGSGKSTLLRCLLGLLTPGTGSVTLGGRDVHACPEPQRAARLAYIPQRPSVAFGFSVADIVALGCGTACPAAGAREQADRALTAVGLADRAGEPLSELSMGQQQRAVLARALAQLGANRVAGATQALLADEPTSAMDPRHQIEAMRLLRAEAADGRIVVVVLHDLTAALRFADRVLVLDQAGSVAAQGPTAKTLDQATLQRVFEVGFVRLRDAATGAEALIPAVPTADR